MKIILIGASGQLGSDLRRILASEELIPLTHQDIEIADYPQVVEMLKKYQPDIVINTAAYHRVDECEDNVLKAFQVNAFGARNVALACKAIDAMMVHMSTDYVFDGGKREPYLESDTPNPINAYGISKLAGEYFIRYLLPEHLIIRTSGLFGIAGSSGKGGNFIELMLKLARERNEIKVVDDQILSPTYTVDLAGKIKELLGTGFYGTCHMTSSGLCSWYEFAKAIFEFCSLQVSLKRTTTEEFGAKANRPRYSVLRSNVLSRLGLGELRPWPEALKAYLKERSEAR